MSSKNKKKRLFRKLFTSSGASCSGCSKLNLADVVEQNAMPKPKIFTKPPNICHTSSSSKWEIKSEHSICEEDQDHTSTTLSINIDSLSPSSRSNRNDDTNYLTEAEGNAEFKVSPCPNKIHGSIAVVKNSDNPYQDFQKSMLQMIFEKEIYSLGDLEELLNCFLHLNSPSHHEIIIQAFMEILWNSGKVVSNGAEKEPCFSSSLLIPQDTSPSNL